MSTERKVVSPWKKKHKHTKMEQVVYITKHADGTKSSVTKHEPVKG